PGNVRELEHALEHATALASTGTIEIADLPASVHAEGAASAEPTSERAPTGEPAGSFRAAKQAAVERFERDFLVAAPARPPGDIPAGRRGGRFVPPAAPAEARRARHRRRALPPERLSPTGDLYRVAATRTAISSSGTPASRSTASVSAPSAGAG